MEKLKVIIGASALLFSSFANASVISVGDSVFGSDSVTRDTESGLEWLDVTLSVNRSYNEVSTQFGVGGDYEGWRYASGLEFEQLLYNYTGVDDSLPTLAEYYSEGADSIDELILLLGDTYNEYLLFISGISSDEVQKGDIGDGHHLTTGIIGDLSWGNYVLMAEIKDIHEFYFLNNDPQSTKIPINTLDESSSHRWIQDRDIANHPYGSYLVRESSVPEPSIIILMFTGLIGLGLARRKF